jgi:prepilin-type N-terminal cleavage/methylation domain-containing protein
MRSKAFTLIELLVVVAIIALLISILLPSLQQAREQGKKAVCLANLKSIGTGCITYSTEDRAEQAIPIHEMMVNSTGEYWLYRTANWFCWGGRDGQARFYQNIRLNGKPAGYDRFGHKPYAAERRPLNKYLYGSMYGNENSAGGNVGSDADNLPLYHCPSDTGYPESPLIDDAPPSAQGVPCYDTMGNSYRGSLYCYISDVSAFAIGPWGHRHSTIPNPGRIILMGEPTFFNMIGQDNGQDNPDPVVVFGWHKRYMVDNLVFVDGHAASTLAEGHETVDPSLRYDMNANVELTSRATTWQIDVYPTPGARIWGGFPNGLPGDHKLWPYAGFQDNLR